ncbi:outer membrane beta-barrel family protein [Aureibacter tunicatorum]|uniref:Outer membrane protein beta-barrel domain-containing protein n=1 Tax=Aureibacter tunicatorum TaxID=866807 RepID=A0AAE3XTJ6_9BACT|nr:outer membrane beta-barrel family protein [Aureibacter tunicatorum]MDR6241755.1 hypothetical protein [Aureibacter tunicatorum]BDD07384.1 hypothetical protein AUTU_48670 [Aureibacter tunicatorum]
MNTYTFKNSPLAIAVLLFAIQLFSYDAMSQSIVNGRLLDVDSNEPVAFATIGVFDENDDTRLLSSAYSDVDGNFLLKLPESGFFTLFIQSVGYDLFRNRIQIDEGQISLKEIYLKSQSTILDEVIVEAEALDVQVTPGAMSFNPENASGDDTEQIISNLPGIDLDFDGNISLQGTEVKILVNGEDSGMDNPMQEIPKESIARIEMMSNPPVEFASSGPVLNIILKEDAKIGSNIRLGMNVSSPYRAKLYTGGTYRKGKFTLSPSFYFNKSIEKSQFDSYRTNFGERYIKQDKTQQIDNKTINSGIRTKLTLDKYNELSAFLRYTPSSVLNENDNYNIISDYNEERTWLYDNDGNTMLDRDKRNVVSDLRWKRKFKKKGRVLNVNYKWNIATMDQHQYQTNNYTYPDSSKDILRSSQQDRRIRSSHHTINAKYKHSFENKMLLTMGGIFNYKLSEEKALNQKRTNDREWIHNISKDQDTDTKYLATDLFADFSARKDKFDYSVGLRYKGGENVICQWIPEEDLFNEFKTSFSNMNTRLMLAYKFKKKRNFAFTFRNTFRPPSSRQLNPFIDDSNPLNVRKGNPDLKNTQTYFAELEYLNVGEHTTLKASLYGRKVINSVISNQWVAGDTTITSYINVDGLAAVGVNSYISGDINNLKLSGDASFTYENMPNRESAFSNSQLFYFLKANIQYKFSKSFRCSVLVRYHSAKLTNNSDIEDYATINVSLQKTFMNRKLKTYASANDIFDMVNKRGITQTDLFAKEHYSKRQTRIFTLGLTYYINGI